MATLNIKNMVCDRCVMTVKEVLEDLGYTVDSVTLGKAVIKEDPKKNQLNKIAERLRGKGFELITQRNQALTEQIKAQLIEYLQKIESEQELPKLSEYLSTHLHRNYSYLSHQFSKQEDVTIEQYLIKLKIERVKELLSYHEMTLSEIAWKLNYSSVQYLSNQFKKSVGMSVSEFKKKEEYSRKSFDSI
jgi:AraC-like DNA-binding protein